MAKRETWLKNKPYNYHSHLSDVIKGVNKETFDKISKYEIEFILKWQNIFGAKIAKITSFNKLSFESQSSKTATLFLNTHPANSLEFTYMEGLLIEQVANYFGYKLVEKIRIVGDYNFGAENLKNIDVISTKKAFTYDDNFNKVQAEISSNIKDENLQNKLAELYKIL